MTRAAKCETCGARTTAPPPPHSIEAEESVIGGILVHARKFNEVAATLVAGDFYHPALRAIYEAMAELAGSSKPIDAVTVPEQMRSLETLDKLRAFNGADYLTELMSKVVTAENIANHAGIVRKRAERRRWAETFRALAAAGYDEGDDDAFFAAAEQQLVAVTTGRRDEASTPRNIKAVMHEYLESLEAQVKRRAETGSGISGQPTGYGKLDEMLSGLQPKDLIIIAGRTSMGKTALAMDIVTSSARMVDGQGRHLYPALVFSLEMGRQQLAERALSGEARVDSRRLRQGDIQPPQWVSLTRAAGNIAQMPVEIIDRGIITMAEIRSIALRWRMGLPSCAQPKVVVDYLQLVSPAPTRGRRQENRTADVSEISRGLKLLAKDLDCPVIALSQLNRSLDSRTDKRPMLSDLRESGAIEQDADVVAFVYRDEVYSKDQCAPEDKAVAEIIIGKQRMGPLATVRLSFIGAYTRFENLSRRGDS